MTSDVYTETYYADWDVKHLEEKPYELKFEPPEGFPMSNMTWSRYEDIRVQDVRGKEQMFDIRTHGFQLIPFRTSLSYDDFAKTERIEQVYLKEVADCIKGATNADRVLVFDYNVRKSQAHFPLSDGRAPKFDPPATIVHIDSTPSWSAHMHDVYCKSEPELKDYGRFQYVNLWRPLRGPVSSWPLMLCDWSTYDSSKDSTPRDIVYSDDVMETSVVYHNPEHAFYYISGQKDHEAWIMVQSDSANGKGVPHTAFQDRANTAAPENRESIEVRAMVYYKNYD